MDRIRHPGNWLPALNGQKRRKVAKKNNVKLAQQTQNLRKNSPYYLVAIVNGFFLQV